MIHLRIQAALPEQYGVYLVNHGKRQYLSEDVPIELELCEGASVTLMQDGPMSRLRKVLAAIGIFLTAPLQLAYLFYGDQKSWDCVIPFRIQATLQVLGDSACRITVTEGETQFHPPRLTVSEPNVTLAEYRCDASPWVFQETCFVHLCRIIGGELWILGLLGYLLTVGITGKNLLGILTASTACLAVVLAGTYLVGHARKICRQKTEHLKRFFSWG